MLDGWRDFEMYHLNPLTKPNKDDGPCMILSRPSTAAWMDRPSLDGWTLDVAFSLASSSFNFHLSSVVLSMVFLLLDGMSAYPGMFFLLVIP
jgi:hypothetical protein